MRKGPSLPALPVEIGRSDEAAFPEARVRLPPTSTGLVAEAVGSYQRTIWEAVRQAGFMKWSPVVPEMGERPPEEKTRRYKFLGAAPPKLRR